MQLIQAAIQNFQPHEQTLGSTNAQNFRKIADISDFLQFSKIGLNEKIFKKFVSLQLKQISTQIFRHLEKILTPKDPENVYG